MMAICLSAMPVHLATVRDVGSLWSHPSQNLDRMLGPAHNGDATSLCLDLMTRIIGCQSGVRKEGMKNVTILLECKQTLKLKQATYVHTHPPSQPCHAPLGRTSCAHLTCLSTLSRTSSRNPKSKFRLKRILRIIFQPHIVLRTEACGSPVNV